jgi:hypothetical protein
MASLCLKLANVRPYPRPTKFTSLALGQVATFECSSIHDAGTHQNLSILSLMWEPVAKGAVYIVHIISHLYTLIPRILDHT